MTLKERMNMQVENIKRVVCLGAGTMGQQIALQSAMYGYSAVMYARRQTTLDNALKRINGYRQKLVNDGVIHQADSEQIMSRITATTNPEEAANEADILSESVPEDPAIKAEVLGTFNQLCPERTIFSTNTSSLLPSMFAKETGRPDRFAALHFHSYVWNSTVVDIMPHSGTSPDTMKTLEAFAISIGQIPVVLERESPNYVVNAMLSALNDAAMTLASNKVTSVEEIDKAWRGVMKMPIGPFGMMDHIGLDVTWQITDQWATISQNPQVQKNAEFLKTYVDRGALGVKSGEGFYSYKKTA